MERSLTFINDIFYALELADVVHLKPTYINVKSYNDIASTIHTANHFKAKKTRIDLTVEELDEYEISSVF
jgi:hypothetical protein